MLQYRSSQNITLNLELIIPCQVIHLFLVLCLHGWTTLRWSWSWYASCQMQSSWEFQVSESILCKITATYTSLLHYCHTFLRKRSFTLISLYNCPLLCPRLIVMADKTNVYKTFPIPLINRLEKHFLVTATAMNEEQLEVKNELEEWAKEYSFVVASDRYITISIFFVILLGKWVVLKIDFVSLFLFL